MYLLLFLSLVQGQTETGGFVFSRGYADMSTIITDLAPSMITSLVVNATDSISFITRDFITQVTVNLENVVLKDFLIQSRNIKVTFSPPQSIGLGISNVSCNAYYNYTETGFNIDKNGSAITSFMNSYMLIDLVAFYRNGSLDFTPNTSNFSITFPSASTVSDTMSNSIISESNTQMMSLWGQTANQGAIAKQLGVTINSFFPFVNFSYPVPGTNMYMQGTLQYPGYYIGDTYVSTQLNGTFGIVNKTMDYSRPQPVNMTFRYKPDLYSGFSQVLVGGYSLGSYFATVIKYYGTINVTSLPPGYPNYLTTANGYFPHLLATYGTTQLALITSIHQVPNIFFLTNGLLFRMQIDGFLQVNSSGTFTTAVTFNYTFDYACTPSIKNGQIVGICYKPRSPKLNIVSNPSGASVVGLKRFLTDLIQYSFYSGDTYFYFPAIPLSYPSGTIINNFYVDYDPDFFSVSFIPIFS